MSEQLKRYLPSEIESPEHINYAGPGNLTPKEKEKYMSLKKEEIFYSGEGD